MIEVEIKVKIPNPDEMRNRFKDNNGVYVISLLHEDTYFNMPEGLRDFKKTDEALRIRKSTEYDKNSDKDEKKTKYYLSYKGKKLDRTTKTRKEIETIIDEGEKLKAILKHLGFKEIFTVQKERELYRFKFKDKEIEALIDYLPILKEHFMEVEILAESVDTIEENTDLLFELLKTFGIPEEDSIRKSYLELIADKFKSKRKKSKQ